MSLIAQLTRHKSIESLQAELGTRKDFRRVLGVWQLTAIGLGGIIGVGIFVLAGQQAAMNAGPAVAISFIIAGIASAAAALCYAEFAGLIPVTGSAYTYGYAVLGEGVAWLIGWDLLLEYALIVAAVASGWSGYVLNLLDAFGIHVPEALRGAPDSGPGRVFQSDRRAGRDGRRGAADAAHRMGRARQHAYRRDQDRRGDHRDRRRRVLCDPANWHPFVPERSVDANGVGHFGWQGVVTAAAVVFFAVFGYDTLTTAAEEAKNPQRDLPRAILLSLGVSMTLYIAITLVLTGMVPYTQLGNDAPVSHAFQSLGMKWIGAAISATAIASILSVIFAFMLAAARIWFALSRDGLLPAWFAKVHPRYGTPYRPTLVLGVFTAIVAGLFPLGEVAKLVNIGVLSAFIVICAAVWCCACANRICRARSARRGCR